LAAVPDVIRSILDEPPPAAEDGFGPR
jgi:hypothetical protein